MPVLEDIQRAHQRISPLAHRTPVATSRLFNAAANCECYLKCENLQRTGSFKIRGAANFLLSMNSNALGRGVVAFSSGNHAQAVAFAAAHTGAKATIVMPTDAPKSKVEATRAYGAQVVTYDRLTENREAIGRKIADQQGATLVPPFDDEGIIAGQGTAVLELLEEVADLDAIVVCIGGGGLISGSAIAANGLNSQATVYGAEPEMANDTFLSLQSGQRVEIPPPNTIADGLRSPKPGALTFPVVQRLVKEIFLVTEDEIRAAQAFIASRMKLVVEPSGAVAAAVVLGRKLPASKRKVGIVISGGNI